MGIELAGNERLGAHPQGVAHPAAAALSYLEQIRATPGVVDVCHADLVRRRLPGPEELLHAGRRWTGMHGSRCTRSSKLPEDQKEGLVADRQGAIVGRVTGREASAGRSATGSRSRRPSGAGRTTDQLGVQPRRDLQGTAENADETQFFFHYKYFDESRLFGKGSVGWYVIRIAEPRRPRRCAQAIDSQFANSPAETKTTTEKAFLQAFANQVGNIALIVQSIIAMAFFIILLVTANTMAESVRERTSEFAVLKTLGFTDGRVLGAGARRVVSHRRPGWGAGTGAREAVEARGDDPGMLRLVLRAGSSSARGRRRARRRCGRRRAPGDSAMRLGVVDALRRV